MSEAFLSPKTSEQIKVAFVRMPDFEDGQVVKEISIPVL